MMDRLIHKYVEPEGCYHEWELYSDNFATKFRCIHCGTLSYMGEEEYKINNYSTPIHFEKLTKKLFGDERMRDEFDAYADRAWFDVRADNDAEGPYAFWLFSDYSRFCSLFSDFLRLPSTIEEFGWETCWKYAHGDYDKVCIFIECSRRNSECAITGRIPKKWAKIAMEGK